MTLFRKMLCLILVLALGGCLSVEKLSTKLWSKHLEKTTNWVQADAEALKYKAEEAEARLYLQELRDLPSLDAVSIKIVDDGFHWRRELLDFTNYPWVTIAKRRGDCDDFMMLWAAVLKYKAGNIKKVFVSSDTSAHAMLLYDTGVDLYLLSNLRVFARGLPGDDNKLVRQFYGDKTRMVIIY